MISSRAASGLLDLIADRPDDQVAAYQQLGQSYAETGENEAAKAILKTGIEKARAAGDWHAAAEMEQAISCLVEFNSGMTGLGQPFSLVAGGARW